MDCAVVLLVGSHARRVPIQVFADMDPSKDMSHFVIDDKYLTLDTRYPWQDLGHEPDLLIGGGSIEVDISYARISRLYTNTTHGRVQSPGNFICASAPLVEVVPDDFIQCDMMPPGDLTKQVYQWYEVTVDDVIDLEEFTIGLDRLGIHFGQESLGLSEEQSRRFMDHVFSEPDLESEHLDSDTIAKRSKMRWPHKSRRRLPPHAKGDILAQGGRTGSLTNCSGGDSEGPYQQKRKETVCIAHCGSHGSKRLNDENRLKISREEECFDIHK
eukprot:gene22314-29387_t